MSEQLWSLQQLSSFACLGLCALLDLAVLALLNLDQLDLDQLDLAVLALLDLDQLALLALRLNPCRV